MKFKWSPTLFRYAFGCSKRFWSYINNEPITNVNREFQDGARAHSAIEQYLKTRDSAFLEGFPASVKRDLDLLLRYDGVLYTEQELEDEEFEGVADIVIEQSDRWIIIDVKSRYETVLEREDYFQLYTYLYLLQKEQYKPEAMVGIFACWNSYNCLGLQHVTLVEPFEFLKPLRPFP